MSALRVIAAILLSAIGHSVGAESPLIQDDREFIMQCRDFCEDIETWVDSVVELPVDIVIVESHAGPNTHLFGGPGATAPVFETAPSADGSRTIEFVLPPDPTFEVVPIEIFPPEISEELLGSGRYECPSDGRPCTYSGAEY